MDSTEYKEEQEHQQIEVIFASPMLEALNQAAQQNQHPLHEEILARLSRTLGQDEIIGEIIDRFAPEIQAALSGEDQCANPLIPLLLNPIKIKYSGDFPQVMLIILEEAAAEKEIPLHTEISMRLLATLLDYSAFQHLKECTVNQSLQTTWQIEKPILH